ncbi:MULTISPECIES: hypothetical protein [unclassified Microcoleus]|uniref:hypothetical protein n=1 Tax=unclassified Microcoleus TaxID=2642155 RepID=UPI002FD4B24C
MSDKLLSIYASLLFAAIPAMLVYAGQYVYHNGYRQAVKDLPPTVVQGDQNIDNSTNHNYQFAPSLGGK